MVELMVEKLVVAPVGGWNGGERERGRNCRNRGSEGWFFSNFGPDFLLPQIINGASIYMRWKRVISFTPG